MIFDYALFLFIKASFFKLNYNFLINETIKLKDIKKPILKSIYH